MSSVLRAKVPTLASVLAATIVAVAPFGPVVLESALPISAIHWLGSRCYCQNQYYTASGGTSYINGADDRCGYFTNSDTFVAGVCPDFTSGGYCWGEISSDVVTHYGSQCATGYSLPTYNVLNNLLSRLGSGPQIYSHWQLSKTMTFRSSDIASGWLGSSTYFFYKIISPVQAATASYDTYCLQVNQNDASITSCNGGMYIYFRCLKD